MTIKEHSSYSPRRNLQIIPKLVILILTILMTFSIVYSIMWSPGSATFPTTLTLKPDTCSLLLQQGIVIKVTSYADNTCSVIVPFRSEPFGHGGEIYLEGKSFALAGDQLIAQQLINEAAAIQTRIYDLLTILVCIVFLLGTLIWAIKG